VYRKGPGLCLKVISTPKKSTGDTIKTFEWGKAPLHGCVVIQNLFACHHALAPRVFDVVRLDDGRFAQVTRFLPASKKTHPKAMKKVESLILTYGLGTFKNYRDYFSINNWRGNKLVDFSGIYFKDPEARETDLVKQAYTRRGTHIGVAYQSVDEMDIKGTRNMPYRVKALKLSEINFSGKTVLDIGCNLGYFCRYAAENGARRVVGIDRIADLSFQISNHLGDWNTDYLRLRLPDDLEEIKVLTGIEKFDIVIAAAVVKHVGGLASWLSKLCKETFIFEGHGSIPADNYSHDLNELFKEVVYLGTTNDNYIRHLFRCNVV